MKKLICIFLCCIILTSYLCCFSFATEDKTLLFLNYGDITIDEYGITGYDETGKLVTQSNHAGYIITQSNPNTAIDKGITVNAVSCTIELNNLNIRRYNEYDCALAAQDTADVTITISGENHLSSGSNRAGLEVGVESKVTINGNGVLYAYSSLQAGIGGGNGQQNGTLIIDSGTIYATGGVDGYSAGIGGATAGDGGNITINGGVVHAEGGLYGSGIGGGFMFGGGNITINGGVITAIGGSGGAGIGSGYLSTTDTNIIINGGSVKALGGRGADNIGNGLKAMTDFSGVHNSSGETVGLVKLNPGNFKQLYINGIDTNPVTTLHPDDDSLYLYTGSTDKIVTAYMLDGSVDFFKVNDSGAEQIYPYKDSCERFNGKLIINSLSSDLVSDGFTVDSQKELFYNSVHIDSFDLVLRGDVNFDGYLDGMDAVICNCVVNSMILDELTIKLCDVDNNGEITDSDSFLLMQHGLEGVRN